MSPCTYRSPPVKSIELAVPPVPIQNAPVVVATPTNPASATVNSVFEPSVMWKR